MNQFLEAALQYAGRGWRVFPCKPKDKTPLIKGGFKAATVVPKQIEAWWEQWPKANVAIATGAMSGLAVIDIDGEEGLAYVQRLCSQHGAFPAPIAAVQTGRGFHLYYDLPPDMHDLRCSSGDGLDVRARGGYVLAPPSIHPSGKAYEWITVGATA